MKPSDFDLLLDRYVDDKLSDAERLKFEAWMDVMKVHKDTNLELSEKDEQEIYQRIISSMTTPEDILKFTPQIIKAHQESQHTISRPWVRIAAVILLLITASVVLYYYRGTQSSLKEVIVNTGSEKVILNDGTIIWLGRGSVLKYNEMGGALVRNVSLSGSALFEVAKDATHPFSISVGDMKVTVMGTSFSIHADLSVIDVKVLTGKVHISSSIDAKGVDVLPNESITYSKQGKVDAVTLHPDEIARVIANTQYDMAFRNTLMGEVFARIEKKFDVDITIENSKMNDCRISGDFTDQSLADTMTMLAEILELKYVIKGKAVAVSGTGCNE